MSLDMREVDGVIRSLPDSQIKRLLTDLRASVAELERSAGLDAVTIEELRAERDALSAQLRAAREQEPVAHIDDLGHIQFTDGGKLKRGDRLYAAPVPPSQEARDAERYRFLLGRVDGDKAQTLFERELDAAILAAKEKK